MQLSYLVLVLVVAAVNSKVIDLNTIVDIGLAKSNEFLREHRFTSAGIPDGQLGEHISFSGSEVLGLDSLKRTGDCTLDIKGRNSSIAFHYGLGFLQLSFKSLKIVDTEMSAAFRIRDNSVRLAFTVHDGDHCDVTLDHLNYERLAKVDFSSSWAEYDGTDVDNIFEKMVLPHLNSKIDRAAVEKSLQAICKQRHLELSEQMPLFQKSVIEHLIL